MYDYGARFYMPDIGRWISPDPLSEEYPDWSPYRYGFNNPISFTDPTGMLEDWYKDEDGSYVYDAQLTAQNASTKLNSNQQYVGESVNVTLMNNGSSVGNMHLGSDGNVSVTGSWAEAGNVSYTTIDTPLGSMMVVDSKLSGGAKVFGVDTFSNSNNEEFADTPFEHNARFVTESSPNTLSKYLGEKIDGVNKKYEIIENSFEEGTMDDPGVSNNMGSIVNSALRNKERGKYQGPQSKLDNMQNDSVLKRNLIYPKPNSTPKPSSTPIPKSKL